MNRTSSTSVATSDGSSWYQDLPVSEVATISIPRGERTRLRCSFLRRFSRRSSACTSPNANLNLVVQPNSLLDPTVVLGGPPAHLGPASLARPCSSLRKSSAHQSEGDE